MKTESLHGITDPRWNTLLESARNASSLAYAPFSNFHVGAALFCSDGEIVAGCNIENSSFPLSICAERVAVSNAVSKGKREFLAMALSVPGNDIFTPCGACRQVLLEFSKEMPILVEARESRKKELFLLSSLLPNPFRLEKK